MLKTGEQTLLSEGLECFSLCVCLRKIGGQIDPSQLVPKTGRHEAFHLVCEEAQGRKQCAEELK